MNLIDIFQAENVIGKTTCILHTTTDLKDKLLSLVTANDVGLLHRLPRAEGACTTSYSLIDAPSMNSSMLHPAITIGPWHEFAWGPTHRPPISILKEMMFSLGEFFLPLPAVIVPSTGPFVDAFYASVADRDAVLRALRFHLSDTYAEVNATPAMLVLHSV